jgi:hypothetical protein
MANKRQYKKPGKIEPGDIVISYNEMPRLYNSLSMLKIALMDHKPGSSKYKAIAGAIAGNEQTIKTLRDNPGELLIIKELKDERIK